MQRLPFASQFRYSTTFNSSASHGIMHQRKRTASTFVVCLVLFGVSFPLLEQVGWRLQCGFTSCHAFQNPILAGRPVLSQVKSIQTSSQTERFPLPITTTSTLMKMRNRPSEIEAHSRDSSSKTSTDQGKFSCPETAIPKNMLRSFLLSLSMLLATATTPLTLPLPSQISTAACWALSPEQLLVDDVWREVSRQFVDPTFAGQGEDGWRKQRLQALQKVSELGPDEDQKVYGVIRTMLESLKDPYTRFLTPEQFESLTNTYTTTSSTSKMPSSGIGVQLIGDNGKGSGGVVVANIVPNSPAEKSGILPGDVIRSIDGVDMMGATAEAVAAKCRGETGTIVDLQIERFGGNTQKFAVSRVTLPESLLVESSVVQNGSSRLGVLKINSFTQETEKKVEEQVKAFVEGNAPVSAIILDLRGNVGGYMPAGVDVAKLFLPAKARIISEIDKSGRSIIYISDGVGSETQLPLYVIVNQKTASASEILTAALQDNHRATVVGETRTFGKGRIQNVQALSSGSGVAITKAKYVTPNGRDIQTVGIVPDIQSKACAPNDSAMTCLDGIL